MIRVATALFCAITLYAQSPDKPGDQNRWQSLQFLIGDWDAKTAGDSGAKVGPAIGGFSFKPELNGQTLVRHSFAEYGKGPMGDARHDDLLIVYPEMPGGLQAIFFDSEGHVIHYNVAVRPNAVTFDSLPSQPGPKFRLSYVLEGKQLNGKFEMAAPGSAEYKTYLSWISTKK